MYTKVELDNKQLAKTAFEETHSNQTMNPIFEYFATISQQYPEGYQQGTVPANTNEQSTQTSVTTQDNVNIDLEQKSLDLAFHALRAGNDRFFPLIKFLLNDSWLYQMQEKPLKEQAEENYSLWADIKWGWAVASAIKVIMEDVKDLLQPHRKLYVMPNMQVEHTYKECFVFFSDIQGLYYINEEAVLSFISDQPINFSLFESHSPSVFKLSAELVTGILQDDTPDDFNLLQYFDENSIALYHTTLLNRLNKLKPHLEENFNYLMTQVLSEDDEELRNQFYIKFLMQIRQYMPRSVEEIGKSIFTIKGENNTEALLARIQHHIIQSSKAEDGAQIAYTIQRTSYVEGLQNLADRKQEDRTHTAKLLMDEMRNGVAGFQIPCEYRPLTEHQRNLLSESPNQPIKAGIPSAHTPLTLQELAALGGKVAYNAIDTKTGSRLYLLALLYRNHQVCEFLKLHADVLHLEEKNLNEITAVMYEQADFSTLYRYTTPTELVRSAREKVISHDAVGELLRKFDSDLRAYKEKWIIRQARIKKREASDDLQDKTYDAIVSFFGMKRSFECRGTEVEFYIGLVEEAFKDPFTSELYNKAKEALKTNTHLFDIFNTELPSQVNSVLKTIKSNEDIYADLQPISSKIVQRYKERQTSNEESKQNDMADVKLELIRLREEKKIDAVTIANLKREQKLSEENTAKAIADVRVECAIQTADAVAKVKKENETEIHKLRQNNIDVMKQLNALNVAVQKILANPSSLMSSENVLSTETKSSHSTGAPGFFG